MRNLAGVKANLARSLARLTKGPLKTAKTALISAIQKSRTTRKRILHSVTAVAVLTTSMVTTSQPLIAFAAAPTYVSSTLDATGRILTITMNTAMNTNTAAPSAFTVKTGTTAANTTASAIVPVDTVAVDTVTPTKLVLTLSRAIESGMTTNVAYTAPASDTSTANAAIQDTAGIDSLTFAAQAVTNTSVVTPRLTAASLGVDVGGLKISLRYSVAMNAKVAPASAFTVTRDGIPVTVASVALNSAVTTDIVLNLATPIAALSVVKITYVPPAPNDATANNDAVQNAAGYDAAPIDQYILTNSSGLPALHATTKPTLGVDGKTLTLTFNEALNTTAGSVASVSDFTVTNSDGVALPLISPATTTGSNVVLKLATQVLSTAVLKVSYTPSGPYTATTGNPVIQDTAGADTVSFIDVAVTNSSSVPWIISQAVEASGTAVVLTYNENLHTVLPAGSAFTVTQNGVAVALAASTPVTR